MSRGTTIVPVLLSLSLAALVTSCSWPSYSKGTEKASAEAKNGPSTRQDLVNEYDELADSILAARRKEVGIVGKILAATHGEAASAYKRAQASIQSGDKPAATAAVEELAIRVAQLGTEGDASVARVRKRLVEGGHHFNPILAPAPGGAHHQDGKGGSHHADGQKPAHHADGQKPAHTQDAQKPGQHAQAPAPDGTPAGKVSEGAPTGQPGHAAGEGHAKDGHHHSEGAAGIGYDPGFVVISRSAKKSLVDASRAIARLAADPESAALAAEWAKAEQVWAGIEKGME